MTVLGVFSKGVRQVMSMKRLVLIFFLPNLLLALMMILPVVSLIHGSLKQSLFGTNTTSRFEILWLEDFLYGHGDALVALLPIWLALAILYFVVELFLVGGALGVFSSGEPLDLRKFCNEAYRHFFILLRLFLLSLLIYGLVLVVYGMVADTLTGDLPRTSATEQPIVLINWALYAVLFFFLSLVNMCFEYARVKAVADRRGGALRETWSALKFVMRNKLRTLSVYYLLLLVQVTVTVLGVHVVGLLSQSSLLVVALVFVVQELFVMLRVTVRLVSYSSEMALYHSLKAVTEEARESAVSLAEQLPST